ncbi:hypothetical protein OC846_001626 [Tilletia horrida]|uniref:Maf-like protein n=1 Tax=Tilletia horrida TaxID=155126 RepID=A0AAN6JTC1_9BASI|nr:hypothetical protein OC845_003035 [Tilletia horrida]KAK0555661.1 hypothetical protein OC846_001626 [Tilletia horrida]KAK0568562.1 hypothetical protein OC861_001810 [Tilletia horrida]
MGSSSSSSAAPPPHRDSAVSNDALQIPALNRLASKRVVLASASPRRAQILASIGLHPEIIPSNFAEDLPKSDYAGEAAYEYPVATSSHKAVEVYQRLIKQDPNDPPELVISADTVVLDASDNILEKPIDRDDNLRMLQELNGKKCHVITGVTIVYPILQAPGYEVKSLSEKTAVHFADNELSLLQAYVQHGEGLDRAGGFAIQGHASVLIRAIAGDYNNVVGFPLFSFITFLNELVQDEAIGMDDDD